MREKLTESLPEKEFSFDAGLKKIIEKINQLLSSQKTVVVAISGPFRNDTRVGKTTLSAKLEIAFLEQGVPVLSAPNLISLQEQRQLDPHGLDYQRQSRQHPDQCLIILSAFGILAFPKDKRQDYQKVQNCQIKEISAAWDLTVQKIDLYILVYRPDQLPSNQERESADIIIRNEQAKD